MYFAAELKQMLPQIVWPIEISLSLFEQNLERMLAMRGKVGSLPELPAYIETLQAFYESVDALKYRFFEQSDRDATNTSETAKKVYEEELISEEDLDKAIRGTTKVESVVVKEVKKALDQKIHRAKTMLEAAKALEKHFAHK